MSLKDVDIGAVLRRMADRRIEEAIEAGKFDNLEGMGKPLDLEPLPADEGARAMYWALRIMKNAEIETDELRRRKRIGALRGEIAAADDETTLQRLVAEHNTIVRELNTMGTNAIRSVPLGPLDEATELSRLRARRGAPSRSP